MISNPHFFNILCVAWGSIALIFTFVNFFLGAKASAWSLRTFAPAKRPVWLVIVSVLYLVLVIYTWYAVATMGISNSWLIAVLLSIGIVKNYFILFDYEGYCQMCQKFLSKPSTVALLNILLVIFSALLIFMGIFYYS